jgi:hypothetical protein
MFVLLSTHNPNGSILGTSRVKITPLPQTSSFSIIALPASLY